MTLLLGASSSGSLMGILLYCAILFGLMYLIAIRPQKKQQQRHQALLETMEVGDSVLTTSGFYGTVIDITEDTVIVEFGNKNCRIPMQKAAIADLEKATK